MENGGYSGGEKSGYPSTPDSPGNIPPPAYNTADSTIPGWQPAAAAPPQTVTVVLARRPAARSVTDAYLLWFPLGLLGLHHFYLRRYGFGVIYLFTLGLGGVGWIVDGFRMPCLVRDANRRIESAPGETLDNSKSLVDAYVLWFPLGFLGLHHYYLGRPLWGVAYTLTGGLFGIGWLIDSVRLPSLVRETNQRLAARQGQPPQGKLLGDAYLLGLTPAGLVGAHHFYLGSPGFGVFYLLTLGDCGIGWIVDWFRMPTLVERANNPYKQPLGKRHKYVDEAYILAFPLGFLGLHHFYLERPCWGVLYLLTLGLGGVGWLVDLCRMPCLVADTNQRLMADAAVVEQVCTHLGVPPAVGTLGYVVTQPVNVAVQPLYSTGYQQGALSVNVMTSGVAGETPILQYPVGHPLPPPYTQPTGDTVLPPTGQPPHYTQYGAVDSKY